MKQNCLILIILFAATISGAQTINLHMNNGMVVNYNSSEVDYIDFSESSSGSDSYTSCPDGNHPHLIDLGLPSGTKWACCNVGANSPEQCGGYYAWGETTEKSSYDWSNYIFCDGTEVSCHSIGIDIAGIRFDAATTIWGSPWVMPSQKQIEELNSNCTCEWTTENGVKGRRFTGSNGASIFLPAAGFRRNGDLINASSYGNYWSSSYAAGEVFDAIMLSFDSVRVSRGYSYRSQGFSVRPVVRIISYIPCPDDNHPHIIDLGLPSGTKWACCNVGASKPEEYGGYFAWGETTEKDSYTSGNYLDGKGESYDIGIDIAGTQYDAATANWGNPWVMPNLDQMNELINFCTLEWTAEKGVKGSRLIGSNGASIFLPAGGSRWEYENYYAGYGGVIWSSMLSESYKSMAWYLDYINGNLQIDYVSQRSAGHFVRPVCKN